MSKHIGIKLIVSEDKIHISYLYFSKMSENSRRNIIVLKVHEFKDVDAIAIKKKM